MSAFPFRTQAVRDLAWACFSPPLLHLGEVAPSGQNVAGCELPLTPDRQRWLLQLDRAPQALLDKLSQAPSRRLGIYFEQLWHFFMEQDPNIDLVAHNLPLRDGGRTLGEFDMIYWCHRRRRHFHLELAVKFYLGQRGATVAKSASQYRQWLGPNSQDRLDLKLQQLLRRQSRLGENPLGRQRLAQLGVQDPGTEIAIKGYLFRHPTDPLPAPAAYNRRCQLQHWIPLQELQAQLQQWQPRHYLLLPKSRWLGPAQTNDKDEILGRSGLVQRLQSLHACHPRSRLVAAVDNSGREQGRFFVTTDAWPATAGNQPNTENV